MLEIIKWRCEAQLHGDMDVYRCLNTVRNAQINADRQKFWDEQAIMLEEVVRPNNLGQVYKMLYIAKAGPKVKAHIIKDVNGNLLTEEECHSRWREYFQSLLNLNSTLRNPATHKQPQLEWGPDDVITAAPVTLG